MKRIITAVLLGAVLSGCGVSHMIKQEKPLDVKQVKPQSGKAAILVTRNTSFGGGVEFSAYLERKMFGVTKGRSCFYKDDIVPGSYHVSAYGENLDTILLTLSPDQTYYLTHDPRMGFWKAAVSTGVTTIDIVAEENKNGCEHYIYDVNKPGEDLNEVDWTYAQKNARKP